MNFKLDGEYVVENPLPECKGLIFKGYHSQWIDLKGFHIKEGFRLLKRRSCSGCPKCGFFIDIMQESQEYIIFPTIEQDTLYSVRVVNESRDWETGEIDGYDIEIYKLPEDLN